jgi:phosphate acyltransferase
VNGVANAVEVAARLVEEDITARIAQDIERINGRNEAKA